MKRVSLIIFTFLLLGTLSCSKFLSPYDAPEVVSHGYVDGVTPGNASIYNQRSYPTVQANWPGPGGDKVWLAVNLGATGEPESSVDDNPGRAGWKFQFNRSQAFHHNGQVLTPQWHTNRIDEGSDWLPENDPCRLLLGDPWRIPKVEEWRAFREAPMNRGGMAEGNRTAAFNSTLRLHAAGELQAFDGHLRYRGENGRYWAQQQFTSRNGEAFGFSDAASSTFGSNKAFGRPVRCIKDD